MSTPSVAERHTSNSTSRPQKGWAELRWLSVLVFGLGAMLILLAFPQLNVSLRSAEIHFVVVSISTLIAMAVSLVVLNVARVLGDGRALLVGTAFLSLSAGFCIHAFATPNVLFVGRIFAVAWSGLFGQIVGGLVLALSGAAISQRLSDWLVRRHRLWLGLIIFAWLVYAVFVLAIIPADPPAGAAPAPAGTIVEHDHSAAAHAVVIPALTPQQWAGGVGLTAYALALVLHARLYLRRRTDAGLVLISGIGLLGEALLAQVLSGSYTLMFWLYHVLEFSGFAALAFGVVLGFRDGMSGSGLLESLLLPGTIMRMREVYARALDRLVADLEHGAAPGEGVAENLRLRFGLSEAQISVLQRAAEAVAEERQRRRQIEELNTGLQRLERDRNQLTQMIVHDLKNPISAIGGFLELLHMGQLQPNEAEVVTLAQSSVSNLRMLVDDLLDVGRLEAGRMELQKDFVSLDVLIRRCVDQMSRWSGRNNMSIVVEVEPDLSFVFADQRLIERLLQNLLSNAIKHTQPGTRIVVSAKSKADLSAAIIGVADNGPGIPPARIGTIFDLYSSGGEGAGQSSSGLGLTLCKLVSEAHGGAISVESTLGFGTVFEVVLPFTNPVSAQVEY